MKQGEHLQQKMFFAWCGYNVGKYPELKWIHAIPNGGKRDVRVAQRLKSEGVKAGVLDVFLPVARRGFHGLYIEFKYGRNKLTESQKAYWDFLEKQGYCKDVFVNWETAKNFVEWYLGE